MNKHTWRQSPKSFAQIVWLALVTLLSLTACGTFKVDIERTPTPDKTARTVVASQHAPAAAQIAPTPTITPTAQAETASPSYQANNHSSSSVISADGRYVVFSSSADNVVPGDTNHAHDIFVYDRQAQATQPW